VLGARCDDRGWGVGGAKRQPAAAYASRASIPRCTGAAPAVARKCCTDVLPNLGPWRIRRYAFGGRGARPALHLGQEGAGCGGGSPSAGTGLRRAGRGRRDWQRVGTAAGRVMVVSAPRGGGTRLGRRLGVAMRRRAAPCECGERGAVVGGQCIKRGSVGSGRNARAHSCASDSCGRGSDGGQGSSRDRAYCASGQCQYHGAGTDGRAVAP
jgi:hypothetical protein